GPGGGARPRLARRVGVHRRAAALDRRRCLTRDDDRSRRARRARRARTAVLTRVDTAAPLRRDVRLLGTILGEVLVEQEGPWLLELVERIRRDAQEARDSGIVAEVDTTLPAGEQALVLRAFGLYFQLANLAEQLHRLRRRREDAHRGVVARESLDGALATLADVPPDELASRAAGTAIRLVLTAHPTEATRRTVLLAPI